MNSSVMTRLLSLNAGFVDTVGFLGLQGLFAAHITGNFVTLAAGFVYGLHGNTGKILALPEFIGAVAVARLVGAALTARGMPTLTILLGVKAVFLAVSSPSESPTAHFRTATSCRLSRLASPGSRPWHFKTQCSACTFRANHRPR
jgi:uncharacterized membrane protein YoaK (UPF0700 family)